MSFVSFLKKAGQVLANVAAVEAGVEPIFKAALPTAAGTVLDKFDTAFKSVVAVEGMFAAAYPGQQTGPQKIIAASTLIAPILASIDAIAGTHTVDSAAEQKAILEITGGIADYINARSGGNVAVSAGGSVPAPAIAVASVPAKVAPAPNPQPK